MQELAKACHSGTSVEHPALALKAQTSLCKTLVPTLLGLLRLVLPYAAHGTASNTSL